jgi:two-component system response regulator
MSPVATEPVEILLVEDNDEDAELTLRALRKHNLTNNLIRVADGAAALDFFFGAGVKQAPRVVLLDLKLPKVDGMEVLRALKSNEQTRAVPIVMLTSSKEDRDLVEAYRLGVNSYIVKPVEFDAFVRAVEQLGMYWALLNQRR